MHNLQLPNDQHVTTPYSKCDCLYKPANRTSSQEAFEPESFYLFPFDQWIAVLKMLPCRFCLTIEF